MPGIPITGAALKARRLGERDKIGVISSPLGENGRISDSIVVRHVKEEIIMKYISKDVKESRRY